MEDWIPRLVLGCVLLVVIAYGYYVSKSYTDYPMHSGLGGDESLLPEGGWQGCW